LYDELLQQQQVKLQELDDLKQNVQLLRDKDLALQESVRLARREVTGAEQKLIEAQQQHAAAINARQKIDEHKEGWQVEARKAAEANVEKELEDFRIRRLEDEM